jgi:hypothetical protein
MSNLLKTFGRDGDSYGRHALVNPGGDNRQGDVIGKLPASALEYVDPMRFDPDYVGRHRYGSVEVVRVVVGPGNAWVLRVAAGWVR